MDFAKVNNKFDERKNNAKTIDVIINENAVSDSEELPINKVDVFVDTDGNTQPYEIDENKVEALRISIEEQGQIEPIIVREVKNGRYQVLAGHHRLAACKAAEKSTILARVVECDDWRAYQIVVESNIKHGNPKPSEIAKILINYKQNAKENGEKLTNKMLAPMFDISLRRVQQLFKLTKLVNDVVELIDDGYISVNSVDEIANLKAKQQRVLGEYVYQLDKALNEGGVKKAVAFLTAEPQLTVEELDERMTAKTASKKYKNAVFNTACDNLILAAKMKEQTEEQLSELVIHLLS
ncbi:MAG: ParB/RepB/Spo0J family partition protein, partial [Ruminococcus sp.]|nr:ParB/RepB/Spo0J family partition protein [Ruminococcus sp.]